MRNLARFIATASMESVAPPAPSATSFTFHTTEGLSQESFVDQISAGLLAARGVTEENQLLKISTESQQQDIAQQHEDLKAQYEDLIELLNPTTHTGSVQVFLLDEAGMASGHAGSASALKALVKASMHKDRKVVAAFTSGWRDQPVDQQVVVSTDAVKSHKALLKSYLSEVGVPNFESMDDLTAFISSL